MARALAVILAVLLLATGATAWSQQDGSRQAARERELLRRAQAAQKQAEEARAALEQDKAKLEGDNKAARAQATKSAVAVVRERRRADELQAAVDALSKEKVQIAMDRDALATTLADTRARLAQTAASLDVAREALAAREKELVAANANAATQARSLGFCETKNLKLYGIATELMGKYRDQGVWDALKRREPFTGLRQVEVENLLEEYRDRAAEARVEVPCRP